MLHCRPMSTWHRFLLVILLALSLPAQAFAVASTLPNPPQSASVQADACLHAHDATMAMPAKHAGTATHRTSIVHANAHATHGCSTCFVCASCGAALPTAGHRMHLIDAAGPARFPPLAVAAVPFLTDGIERPPRLSQV